MHIQWSHDGKEPWGRWGPRFRGRAVASRATIELTRRDSALWRSATLKWTERRRRNYSWTSSPHSMSDWHRRARRLNAPRSEDPVAELLGTLDSSSTKAGSTSTSACPLGRWRSSDQGHRNAGVRHLPQRGPIRVRHHPSGTGTPRRPSSTPRTFPTSRRRSLRRSLWFTANSSVSRAQKLADVTCRFSSCLASRW
jgi:hypothetical protein